MKYKIYSTFKSSKLLMRFIMLSAIMTFGFVANAQITLNVGSCGATYGTNFTNTAPGIWTCTNAPCAFAGCVQTLEHTGGGNWALKYNPGNFTDATASGGSATNPPATGWSGFCSGISLSGPGVFTPPCAASLTSGAGSNNQTVTFNTAMTNITWSTTSATGVSSAGLPAGVNAAYNSNVITISGTPTATGTFNYTLTPTGTSCPSLTGIITVNAPPACYTLTSAAATTNQSICVGAPITDITFTVTSGITSGAFTPTLPTGLVASVSGNVLTISGTPTAAQAATSYNLSVASPAVPSCSPTNPFAFTLVVNAPLQIDSLVATPVAICEGDSTSLQAYPGISVAGTYCTSNATSLADTRIDTVSFAGISTGNATGGQTYTDNTGIVIPVTASTAYPLAIANGTAGSHYASYVKVFIDYDQSGSFEPSEEVYAFGNTTAVNTIPSTTVTIPTSAYNGTTRMRVVLRESGSATSTVACGLYTFGETEDYTIDISGGATPPIGFASIAWTPSATLNMASGDSVVAQGLTATTLFTAIGADANGCMDTASVNVSVTPSPVVTASIATSPICPGDTTTITAAGANIYSWNSGTILGTNITVSPAATTTYTVTGTETATGCSADTSVTLLVSLPLVIDSITASPDTVCAGGTSMLAASARVISTFDLYSFASATGTTLDPMTSSTTAVGSNEDDTYTSGHTIGFNFDYNGTSYTTFGTSSNGFMVLGGAGGSSDLGNGFGTSMDAANLPMIAPWWDDCHTRNDSITFTTIGTAPNRTLIVDFGLAIRYLSATANTQAQVWLHETTNEIELVYGPSTALNSPSGSVGLAGTTTTAEMQSVNTANNTSSTTTASNSLTVFPADGTKYTFTPPAVTTITYAWTPAGDVVNPTMAMTGTNPLSATTNFIVSATDGNTGCVTTDSVEVFVKSTPTLAVSVAPSAAVCTGDTATLVSGATNYSTITWNGTSTAGADSVLAPAMAGTYTVIATDTMSGCSVTDSVMVMVNPYVLIDSIIASPSTICAGDTANIQTYPGIVTLPCQPTWTSPGASGDYIESVIINGTNYSTNGDNPADYAMLGSVGTYATGTPITVATQTGPAWAGGIGIWIDYDQSGTFDLSEFAYAGASSTAQQTGTITIPATAYNGTTAMRVVEWYNHTMTGNEFCAAGDFGETEDYTITITGGVPPVPPVPGFATITWAPTTGLTPTSGDNVNATITTTTTYVATATTAEGCASIDSVTITVNPLPVITATVSPTTALCPGDTAMLSATSASVTVFTWEPGTLAGANQSVTPTATTDYIVSGPDANGCVGLDTVTVTVNPMVPLTVTVDSIENCIGTMNGGATALSPGLPIQLYFEGFESYTGTEITSDSNMIASLTNNWSYSQSLAGGRVRFNAGAGFYHTGAAAATLDRNPSGAVTINYLITQVDLSANASDPLTLSFWFAHHGEESHANDRVWVRGSSTDPWVQAYDWYANIPATGTFAQATVDLVAVLAGASQTVSSTTGIRFGQEDNFPATSTTVSDGFTVDDIQITTPSANSLLWSTSDTTASITGIGAGTYTVTATDINGCKATDSAVLVQPTPSGDLTQSTVGNTASNPGSGCDTLTQPNDGSTNGYFDASCAIIASVQEPAGGISLGMVTSCATVDATNQVYQGQPYVARHFEITPTTQGPANVSLYFTDDDFADYNLARGTFDSIATNAGANTTATICITQVSGGPLGTGTPTVHGPLTATWDAVNMRWQVDFPVTGFSTFYCHTCNFNNAALAVEYKEFTVTKQATSDLVEWTTVNENQSSHFNVQRSADGNDFITLGTVETKAPNGNSAGELNYSFVDAKPMTGHNYYRLEQVDMDNKTSLSEVIDIVWGTTGSVVSIYPNPATHVLNIDLTSAQAANTEVKLVDMSGRVVNSISMKTSKGLNHMTLNLGEVATGVYGVQIFENNKLTSVAKIRKN